MLPDLVELHASYWKHPVLEEKWLNRHGLGKPHPWFEWGAKWTAIPNKR
jgi:hypothetical protein